MFIRQFHQNENGTRRAYWALVESYRTERGPRQRVVAWLGKLNEEGRLAVEQAARPESRSNADQQLDLFDEQPASSAETTPQWVEVDAAGVRVEDCRQFGGPWLALQVVRRLELDAFLRRVMPQQQEQIARWRTALILVVARLCDPSSELYVSEQWYPKTALPELLGVPAERVDDNRLYRTLDALLPHKEALEIHLKNRLGELFDLEYDLLMYDITSTYFEGEAKFEMAARGHSRDRRGDCKQVCLGLVVSRCGMPLGYEVFAGNTADVTTVEQIVETMEARYGKSDRIWVMDRGMVSEANLDYLINGGRRFIVGTPKSMLKKFEAELLKDNWNTVRDGVEVKIVTRPRRGESGENASTEDSSTTNDAGGNDAADAAANTGELETYILCRSQDRQLKEQAMVARFEAKIEERLKAMTARCEKQLRDPMKVEREIGKMLARNTRAARLFDVKVETGDDGQARIRWSKKKVARDWATLSAGCYLLRTNVTDWSDEELWKAYIQLTEAEAAFRIQKSDLKIRPVWHQKQDRVLAHILVCFLAYAVWKTLAQMCRQAGIGDEPRRVLSELGELRQMQVVLPTRSGVEIRRRCISTPNEHQQILLKRLKLKLPKINRNEM